jgi:hypothetical protein
MGAHIKSAKKLSPTSDLIFIGVAYRPSSHTPDKKALPAKRNCVGHPALCAAIWFGDLW